MMIEQTKPMKITDRVDLLERKVNELAKLLTDKTASDVLEEDHKPRPKPQPTTTVTVWWDDTKEHPIADYKSSRNDGMLRMTYTSKGTPDIGRVINETLEQGALAVKVECTEEFRLGNFTTKTRTVYLYKKELGMGGFKYEGYWGGYIRTDSNIESAITEWLEKQKEPKFRVGEIVVLGSSGIVRIEEIQDDLMVVTQENGVSLVVPDRAFRPATPAEIAEFHIMSWADVQKHYGNENNT